MISLESPACEACLGLDACCPACGGAYEPDRSAERWKNAGPGKCAGCERDVKNRFSRGKGAACLPCLLEAWGQDPTDD